MRAKLRAEILIQGGIHTQAVAKPLRGGLDVEHKGWTPAANVIRRGAGQARNELEYGAQLEVPREPEFVPTKPEPIVVALKFVRVPQCFSCYGPAFLTSPQ